MYVKVVFGLLTLLDGKAKALKFISVKWAHFNIKCVKWAFFTLKCIKQLVSTQICLVSWELVTEGAHFTHFNEMRDRKNLKPGIVFLWFLLFPSSPFLSLPCSCLFSIDYFFYSLLLFFYSYTISNFPLVSSLNFTLVSHALVKGVILRIGRRMKLWKQSNAVLFSKPQSSIKF